MIIGDNQAASKGYFDSAKEYFKKIGVKVVGEETWPINTLTDATPVIQKVKSLNPDIIIANPSAISEAQMCLMKRKELNITTPFVFGGAYAADPSFLQIGAEFLEGVMSFTPSFPHKLTPQDWVKRSLDQCRKEYSDEAWPGQELSYGWTMVPIMAEILERAGSRDRKVIRDTAYKLDIQNVMATRMIVGQGMAFDETGRIAKKYQGVLLVQWQKGKPYPVYPSNLALGSPVWGSK
jgi:ABC-type branched-subunit amino acid transport system substrate-binding protein